MGLDSKSIFLTFFLQYIYIYKVFSINLLNNELDIILLVPAFCIFTHQTVCIHLKYFKHYRFVLWPLMVHQGFEPCSIFTDLTLQPKPSALYLALRSPFMDSKVLKDILAWLKNKWRKSMWLLCAFNCPCMQIEWASSDVWVRLCQLGLRACCSAPVYHGTAPFRLQRVPQLEILTPNPLPCFPLIVMWSGKQRLNVRQKKQTASSIWLYGVNCLHLVEAVKKTGLGWTAASLTVRRGHREEV